MPFPAHRTAAARPPHRTASHRRRAARRFADGDPTNNVVRDFDLLADYDVRDMTFRHGGDFVGVTSRLDYIQGLGCRAIWISPVFQNGYNEYHQYAQKDFTLIDRRMGTLDELRQLTTEAHKRHMYVFIDIVVNHMGDMLTFKGAEMGQPSPLLLLWSPPLLPLPCPPLLPPPPPLLWL